MDGANNSGRRGSTTGRGRGYGQGSGGRGRSQNYPNQTGGRGWDPAPRGPYHQSPARPELVNRPPVQGNHQPVQQARGYRPVDVRSTARPVGISPPPVQGAWGNRPPPQQQAAGGRGWGPRPPAQSSPPMPPPTSPDELAIQTQRLEISQSKSQSEATGNPIQPIKRPDRGGTISIRSIGLVVNHFPVKYDPKQTMYHYDVDMKPLVSDGNNRILKKMRKSDMLLVRDKLFCDNVQFKNLVTAYDGEKNIFSAVHLPTGQFTVNISEGEDMKSGSYVVTIKLVSELKLSKLNDYIRGSLSYVPRDVLQGMELVMKENPTKKKIVVGRSFFNTDFLRGDDLGGGVAAYRGFQQSLKPTSHGLSLCLDCSVLAFRKPLPVIDFLKEQIPNFRINDVGRMRQDVNSALRGLKVTVNHRRTKQRYTVAGLAEENASETYFDQVDEEGKNPKRTSLLQYFKDKWGKDIMYKNIPCLELGKGNKPNKVPMEFCVLVVGQRYPKEDLDKNVAVVLKNLSLAKPNDRRNIINEMVRAEDGPCGGGVIERFGMDVDPNMTQVVARVMGAPQLKLGSPSTVTVDKEKCQWNLVSKRLVDGKVIERWAVLDFTDGDRRNQLYANEFISDLVARGRNLGMQMKEPLLHYRTRMNEFSSIERLEKLLQTVIQQCSRKAEGKLQFILCAMTRKDPGYKFLKWVSETQIGVLTQCCLSTNANKGQDQYLANLCLKINAKLGGNNFELVERPLHFDKEPVMFIGADVNHPAPMNKDCPSIAAVVGTVNWPAANRYAAKVAPQAHRSEKIVNFGSKCLELVKAFDRFNKFKPRKIVVFRDGVSDGQFEMTLAEELADMKKVFAENDYHPTITLIVAQKRHHTRLFVANARDGGRTGNVPPGTVVDTTIVHPLNFDFYLCSHFGGLGTSKPTHYYVLWDENSFSSDQLQKLIYDMCFTFVRCTKPVSLVPPVYYADLAAYRGRMFEEAVLDGFTSANPPTFNPSSYELHPDLKDIMFFI